MSKASPPPRTAQPNSMTFIDDRDVTHHVHIPKGTNSAVIDFFMKQDWEALRKLPAWTNAPEQQYDCMDHLKDFDMEAYQALETKEEREKFWWEYVEDCE